MAENGYPQFQGSADQQMGSALSFTNWLLHFFTDTLIDLLIHPLIDYRLVHLWEIPCQQRKLLHRMTTTRPCGNICLNSFTAAMRTRTSTPPFAASRPLCAASDPKAPSTHRGSFWSTCASPKLTFWSFRATPATNLLPGPAATGPRRLRRPTRRRGTKACAPFAAT